MPSIIPFLCIPQLCLSGRLRGRVIGCVSTDVFLVQSQQFDTDNYNVIVGDANC